MTCTCDYCNRRKYPHTNLEDFRKAMCGINPYNFYQWDSGKLRSVNPKRNCSPIVRQSAGSMGCDGTTVGRLDILQALLDAETIFQEHLGFDVVPTRHISTIKHYKWGDYHYAFNNYGGYRDFHNFTDKVVTPFPYVIDVGKEICTEIGVVEKGTASYQLASVRSGGILDTFTLTVNGVTSINEKDVRVYIHPDERTDDCEDIERWRIPTNCVTLSGGTLTITGGAWLLGKPELLESYVPLPKPISEFGDFSLDPANLDCYVNKLVITSCTVDNCQGSSASFKPCGCPTCKSDASHCETCSNVSFCVENGRSGVLSVVYPFESLCQGRPTSFCIDYRAGNCSRDWAKDISILAVANFCKPICPCATLGCLNQWYEDLALDDYKGTISDSLTENPLGTRRGHVIALKQIHKFSQRNIASIAV